LRGTPLAASAPGLSPPAEAEKQRDFCVVVAFGLTKENSCLNTPLSHLEEELGKGGVGAGTHELLEQTRFVSRFGRRPDACSVRGVGAASLERLETPLQ